MTHIEVFQSVHNHKIGRVPIDIGATGVTGSSLLTKIIRTLKII